MEIILSLQKIFMTEKKPNKSEKFKTPNFIKAIIAMLAGAGANLPFNKKKPEVRVSTWISEDPNRPPIIMITQETNTANLKALIEEYALDVTEQEEPQDPEDES
jgi:hypothetical protein